MLIDWDEDDDDKGDGDGDCGGRGDNSKAEIIEFKQKSNNRWDAEFEEGEERELELACFIAVDGRGRKGSMQVGDSESRGRGWIPVIDSNFFFSVC